MIEGLTTAYGSIVNLTKRKIFLCLIITFAGPFICHTEDSWSGGSMAFKLNPVEIHSLCDIYTGVTVLKLAQRQCLICSLTINNTDRICLVQYSPHIWQPASWHLDCLLEGPSSQKWTALSLCFWSHLPSVSYWGHVCSQKQLGTAGRSHHTASAVSPCWCWCKEGRSYQQRHQTLLLWKWILFFFKR